MLHKKNQLLISKMFLAFTAILINSLYNSYMFWVDNVAFELKKRKLPLEWVDDMKTPSGKIHVGSLRGVIVHDLVFKALKQLSVKTKFTYIFDNHDPMDALPVYLSKEKYEKYLGMPLYKVPSPEKRFNNYAEYYALEFKSVFNNIGCNPEILWSTDLYLSGKMNPLIKECLDKALEIRKIYEELYEKKIAEDWYPFQPYCSNCGKVSTTRAYDWDGKEVSFVCEIDAVSWTKGCGFKGKMSPFSSEKGIAGKLPWKIEWPAKWKALGITVEGAGEDHMSRGGSHDLASLICQRIIKYPVPYALPYMFFLIGGRKMSSSKGRGSSASEMLEILPPELLRFLMVKTKIGQQINFDPAGDTIPNLFDDYQKAADAYFNKKNDDLARIFELSQIKKIKKPPTASFRQLVQWVQAPNMKYQIEKEGALEWIPYVKVWIERFAPQENRFLFTDSLSEKAKNLSETQRKYLQKIINELDKEWQPEELQKELFEWSKELGLPSSKAFAAIYLTLFNKNYGPKAGWIILSDKEFIKKRFLDAVNQ
jgi:lysyl-tRNA synthetase, class I